MTSIGNGAPANTRLHRTACFAVRTVKRQGVGRTDAEEKVRRKRSVPCNRGAGPHEIPGMICQIRA
jgi:hypothetical protein